MAPLQTLEEAKAWLRLEGSADDALVAGLVRAAGALCEAFVGRVLVRRELLEELWAPADGGWARLAQGPVSAILGVEAVATDGSAAALPVAEYAVAIDADGDGWVRAPAGRRLRVRYVAGLAADWNGVPEPLRHGVARLAAHLHREGGEAGGAPPAAVTALWRPWRRVRVGGPAPRRADLQ